MHKITPNPPPKDSAALLDAASRAAHHALPPPPHTNGYLPLFSINAAANTEALLANAYETLNGACGLVQDLAETMEDKQRCQLLAIGQLLELTALLVDRAMKQRCPV